MSNHIYNDKQKTNLAFDCNGILKYYKDYTFMKLVYHSKDGGRLIACSTW